MSISARMTSLPIAHFLQDLSELERAERAWHQDEYLAGLQMPRACFGKWPMGIGRHRQQYQIGAIESRSDVGCHVGQPGLAGVSDAGQGDGPRVSDRLDRLLHCRQLSQPDQMPRQGKVCRQGEGCVASTKHRHIAAHNSPFVWMGYSTISIFGARFQSNLSTPGRPSDLKYRKIRSELRRNALTSTHWQWSG